jgi:hypothetical protein
VASMECASLVVLVGVITLGFVDNERAAASRRHDFCIHAEMKIPDWTIWDVVFVGHVSPQEYAPIFDREFLDICHRHEHRRAWNFGSGSESHIRLIGHYIARLRKVWLGSWWEPFCRYPISGFSCRRTTEIFPSHGNIGPRREIVGLIWIGTEMRNIDDLRKIDVSAQLEPGGFDLLFNRVVGLKQEISTYAGGNDQRDSGGAQYSRPVSYRFLIALGVWIIAATCGAAGLLIGLFRQDSGLLYLLSLFLALVLGTVGAALL